MDRPQPLFREIAPSSATIGVTSPIFLGPERICPSHPHDSEAGRTRFWAAAGPGWSVPSVLLGPRMPRSVATLLRGSLESLADTIRVSLWAGPAESARPRRPESRVRVNACKEPPSSDGPLPSPDSSRYLRLKALAWPSNDSNLKGGNDEID